MRVKATDIFKLILYYKQAVDWYTKSANQGSPSSSPFISFKAKLTGIQSQLIKAAPQLKIV